MIALLAVIPASACQELPGTRTQQATAAGGAAGAAVGAAASENRLVGALVGGALGAGAGYIVGAHTDWFQSNRDTYSQAQRAVENAQQNPATVESVHAANPADLNADGFVTTDELSALAQAGLTDQDILRRLEATGNVFDLSPSQEQTLRTAGLSDHVIREMQRINRDERERLLGAPEVLGRPAE
jgi:hypothetical protein